MSEEKVLTLRGKKAVWAPAPSGVGGGGDFIVTPTMSEDMTSCTLDKTVPEIWNAAKSGI